MFLSLKCIFSLKILHFVSRLPGDNVTTDLKPGALAKHYFVCQTFKNNIGKTTINVIAMSHQWSSLIQNNL